jgi:hypothetical protein
VPDASTGVRITFLMIEVTIRHVGSDVQLGRITIENIQMNQDGTADYSIQFGVDRHSAVGVHRRAIWGFPREKYNVFALLLQALNTLEPPELELDTKPVELKKKRLGWHSRRS